MANFLSRSKNNITFPDLFATFTTVKRRSIKIHPEETGDFKDKLLLWAQQFDHVTWLDSNTETPKNSQKYSNFDAVLAVGAEKKLQCNYRGAFDKLKSFYSETNDYLFGYLGYDLKNDIEDLKSKNFDGLGFSDMYFYQPKKIFFIHEHSIEIAYLKKYGQEIEEDLEKIKNYKDTPDQQINIIPIEQRISKADYFQKLHQILEHIHRGDIYEVNFCQEFYVENAIIDPFKVYQKLNAISSPPFATFLKINNQFLLCASPERFVKKQGSQIISQPIKGTARRLFNDEEDQKIASELRQDPKERAENIMIVDLVRNDLSKTALKGSVNVEELCEVYSFKQVHQLISTLVARVDEQTNAIDVIKSLFPMGSMTGAPKISAMKIIEEQEESKRSLYSGAVGYFTPNNDFDFNVVIRSILYNQNNKYVSFSVGGAITSQSIIENEYEECLLKAKAMKKALIHQD